MENHDQLSCPRSAISWITLDEKRYAIVYDSVTQAIVWPMVDYAIFMTDDLENDPKTVESSILAIAAYRRFLVDISGRDAARRAADLPSLEFHESTDRLIRKFRESEFRRVKEKVASSHDESAARRTVNAKLIQIYHFLNWYRWTSEYKAFFGMQNFCLVKSALKESDVFGRGRSGRLSIGGRRSSRDEISNGARYPLLYKRTLTRTLGQDAYTATDLDKQRIDEYFAAHFTAYVALRNMLIADLADQLGWRRASINSLTCSQFSVERLEKMEARGLACVPPQQKFGYRDSYYIPPALAIKISAFISDTRAQLVNEMGWDAFAARGAVFISARDGKGLTNKTLSKIFSKAFAAIGAPKRSGLKSFRRKFTNTAIAAETSARLQLGLDTSSASVSASVSMDLGHHNPASIKSYVDQNQVRLASRKRDP
ncbi:hypothetical protein [Paraburkholderia kirstenboschensis]|uniref:Tyr recombinase domain-containing protein n=1 Tax=Paraburkholderia kirstenboschensis TaxID=1245436 RepID=A0ABZ0ENS9_9BURK|nr:hypothetical protein [Paraburkholderia kirstenboschensis]WOD18269.1 hypothetical protein RW095_36535 [Paraburkholderia kirstenboschensis]